MEQENQENQENQETDEYEYFDIYKYINNYKIDKKLIINTDYYTNPYNISYEKKVEIVDENDKPIIPLTTNPDETKSENSAEERRTSEEKEDYNIENIRIALLEYIYNNFSEKISNYDYIEDNFDVIEEDSIILYFSLIKNEGYKTGIYKGHKENSVIKLCSKNKKKHWSIYTEQNIIFYKENYESSKEDNIIRNFLMKIIGTQQLVKTV